MNAGGTDAVNGERIDTWEDQSGNGNDVTQGTDASRPTYNTAVVNGQPVLSFDGGDQLNNTTFSGMAGKNGGSVFSVLLCSVFSVLLLCGIPKK